MLPIRALRSSGVSEGQRATKEVQGRSITFLRHHGKVHAFDSNCYHMGGPLAEGDIEELASGHLCITCPWHKYRIDLETGGKVDSNLHNQMCTSAPKQRIYEVIDDSEYLWIKLDPSQHRESDKYNGSLLQSPMHSSKSAQSSGYGLGSLPFGQFSQFGGLNGLESRGLDTSFSPARSGMSEDVLGSQESTSSTAYLEPFGGADKFYPPPSPLKPRPANDGSTSGRLLMRGRKAPNMRGAAARAAVLQKYKPPPSSVGTPEPKPGSQRTITEMFGRVPQAPPAVHTGVQDMEL